MTTLSLGQEHQYPVVAATRMNIVYAGLENPSIAVPGLASEDLVIEVDTFINSSNKEMGGTTLRLIRIEPI